MDETSVQEKQTPINQLTKEEAREQWDRHTRELNIKHTFSFDEAWDFLEQKRKQNFRESITKAETEFRNIPGVLSTREDIDRANPIKHTFIGGCYIREIYNPADELIITKIWKVGHPYFLMKGDMSIMTENGATRIKAPYHGITQPGTKRIIYTHTECVFITVHGTKETSIEKAEEEILAKNFDEVDTETVKNFIDIVNREG